MFSPSIFTNSHSPTSLLFFGISENAGPSSYLEQLVKFRMVTADAAKRSFILIIHSLIKLKKSCTTS